MINYSFVQYLWDIFQISKFRKKTFYGGAAAQTMRTADRHELWTPVTYDVHMRNIIDV